MLCCVSIIGKIQPCSATPPPTSTWNPVNTYQTTIHSELYLEPPIISESGRTCYMNALMQQLYNIDGMIIVVIPEKHGEIKKEIVLKDKKTKYLKGIILHKESPDHMYSYINTMDDNPKSYWFLADGQTVEDIGYTMPDTQDSYLAFYWNK